MEVYYKEFLVYAMCLSYLCDQYQEIYDDHHHLDHFMFSYEMLLICLYFFLILSFLALGFKDFLIDHANFYAFLF